MGWLAVIALVLIALGLAAKCDSLHRRLDEVADERDRAQRACEDNGRALAAKCGECERLRKQRDDHKAAWQKASDERDALARKLADGIRVLSGEGES